MNCYKHKNNVNGYTNPQLAEEIGNLHYGSAIELFNALSKKFEMDSETDKSNGREKLASNLLKIAFLFKDIEIEMSEAWKICEPYMKEN